MGMRRSWRTRLGVDQPRDGEMQEVSHYEHHARGRVTFTTVRWTGAILAAWRAIFPSLLKREQQQAAGRIARGGARRNFRRCRNLLWGCWRGLAFSILLIYFPDRDEFSVVAGPVHHSDGAAVAALAGIVWFLFVTRTTRQRASADGSDHVHGCCNRKQYPGDQLFEGANDRGQDSGRIGSAGGHARGSGR